MTDELLFNPFDPAFRADPQPFYDRLREREPAHWTPFGTLVLSRYEDIAATLRSNDFSRDVEANANVQLGVAAVRRREVGRTLAKTILNLDPPDHTRLRRLVSLAFTPSAIERLRPRIQQLVDDVLDTAQERGSIELIDELAFPVPFQVISDLLDMPTDRVDELRAWSQVLTASLEPTATEADVDASQAVLGELIPYMESVIEQRRRNLGDDMLSQLILAEESGDRLSTEELLSFVVLLYIAGHETTVNLIGNSTLALLRNPAQLRDWAGDPSLDSAAVDELLRFDGPVQLTVRVAMVPVTYGSDDAQVVAEPGTVVMTLLGAANHDPAMFTDPHRLDLRRPNANRHLAFAAGIHYCLGSNLARLEAQIAVGSLVRRFPDMQIDGEPSWRDRLTIRGVDRLRLTLR